MKLTGSLCRVRVVFEARMLELLSEAMSALRSGAREQAGERLPACPLGQPGAKARPGPSCLTWTRALLSAQSDSALGRTQTHPQQGRLPEASECTNLTVVEIFHLEPPYTLTPGLLQ
ncbi:hypothetical protein SKAU_G00242060 [Synaphobranchus kaupii]|uniref:Uncharacterized protein n=1 Tax=Synaphobranchus kaupii TaxID=118154 RepID=A0A9Q1F7W8_SYNKA|nr:hypothetical protein SKAU_G00242060 [Synaphobranchus kaupii]